MSRGGQAALPNAELVRHEVAPGRRAGDAPRRSCPGALTLGETLQPRVVVAEGIGPVKRAHDDGRRRPRLDAGRLPQPPECLQRLRARLEPERSAHHCACHRREPLGPAGGHTPSPAGPRTPSAATRRASSPKCVGTGHRRFHGLRRRRDHVPQRRRPRTYHLEHRRLEPVERRQRSAVPADAGPAPPRPVLARCASITAGSASRSPSRRSRAMRGVGTGSSPFEGRRAGDEPLRRACWRKTVSRRPSTLTVRP